MELFFLKYLKHNFLKNQHIHIKAKYIESELLHFARRQNNVYKIINVIEM